MLDTALAAAAAAGAPEAAGSGEMALVDAEGVLALDIPSEAQGRAIERREGGGRVQVPPSLRSELGDEISRSRVRTLAA